MPKASEEGDASDWTTPFPLNATVLGLLGELLVMVSVPAGWAPSAVGLRLMPMLQLAPAASEAPHGDVAAVGRPYGPPAVTELYTIYKALGRRSEFLALFRQ